MVESSTPSPFVLGKPIKEPEDFHGREHARRELFESIMNMQPVALVGEHRCGNTSLLYQMMHEDVQAEFIEAGARDGLLFAFLNAQLAGDSPESLFRRLARTLKRADPDSSADFEEDPIDAYWLEDYLDDLADRDKRLVLLLDEFDVLAEFEPKFWEWFRGLITEYDMSIVVASRVDLGEFETQWGTGSPFFNMFRSIYVGSFTAEEAAAFLDFVSDLGGVDLRPVAPEIARFAGRFPYYMQVAGSLFHEHAVRGDDLLAESTIETVDQEFRARTEALFNDVWARLPAVERDALCWLAVDAQPEGREGVAFEQASQRLFRRGYVYDDAIFSTAMADFARRQMTRIELNAETGEVRIEKRPVELPPKEFALLRFLLSKRGEIVTKDEIAIAVWPEYSLETLGVTDAMIQKTISRLRKEVDAHGSSFQHIESIRGQGYRFRNANIATVYQGRDEFDDEDELEGGHSDVQEDAESIGGDGATAPVSTQGSEAAGND